jgi:hypothetical protein
MQVISLLRRIATLLIFSVAVFTPVYSQNNTRSMLDTDTSSVLAVAQMISDTFGAPVDLVAEFIAQAKKLEVREGIPATAFIGIAILESTGFTSYLYQNARNPFGMRATAPWRGATFVMWHEGKDAPFRKYSSPAEAVRDFNRFLESRKWFKDALIPTVFTLQPGINASLIKPFFSKRKSRNSQLKSTKVFINLTLINIKLFIFTRVK